VRSAVLAAILGLVMTNAAAAQEPVRLYAAGSLRAVLDEIGAQFAAETGTKIASTYAASGLLRERIEKGEPAEVFASANMEHPTTLAKAGKAGPVVLFARNQLCALARPGLAVQQPTLLDRMLDPTIKLGTSTPKADPSGDYAWEVFEKAEKLRPGSFAALDRKALKLTGGPGSPPPLAGRNTYAALIESGAADIFLTYCTNAVLAKSEVPALQIVALPLGLTVGADYGLTVLNGARPEANRFAFYMMSPTGQAIFARHGFSAVALPAGS
jgi:ABC-type molybdate transport system substrate-binding protein